jgi:hypothetical protein
MVLARRLLTARGGSGSFTPPVASVFAIAAAQKAATDIQFPLAMGYNGRTYLTYINMANGDAAIGVWDNATDAFSSFVLHASFQTDNHAAPAVLVRSSDHRIVTAYVTHDGPAIKVRISTNPEDISAFGSEQSFSPGAAQYSYPTLVEMGDGTIYLFYRDFGATTELAYVTSSDGGATWSAQTSLYRMDTGIGYWRILGDGGTRIDFSVNDRPPASGNGKVGHFYMDAGVRHKTDGTVISASLPITFTNVTLVESNGDGSHCVAGIARSGSTLAMIFMVHLSGPNDSSIREARSVSGGAWSTVEVCQAGGITAGNEFLSGASPDPADPGVVWAARKVGSHFEMFRCTSADGVTWTNTALTSGSSVEQVLPIAVLNPVGLEAIWSKGTYTSDTNNDFAVMGYGLT